MLFTLINKYASANPKNDILSGLTVALALVPEAVAFAIIAGVNPLVGLYAAFTIGLVTSIAGGRPGMISGATGAIAVVVAPLIALVLEQGATLAQATEYLFAAVILAGFLQILFGVLKLGKFIRLVPHPVFLGFVNGIALVIFAGQIKQFELKDGTWITGEPLMIMLAIAAATMAVIHFLPKITKTVPAILVAVIAGTLAVITLGIETRTVGDIASIKGGFPPFHMPNVPFDLEMLKLIFPFAVTIAAVGLIESLLTLNLVDDLTETTGQPNRESVGQGLANSVTGLFGGMGGCAMVGQSIINVKSGGRGRLSGIVASLALLAFIVYLSEYVEMIPIAVLVGVMMMVVIGTFQWCTLRLFGKVPVLDVITGISVAVITLWTSDLALAVVVGVILSALSFAWESASKIYIKQTQNDNGDNIYKVKGTLFFASKEHFQELFDPKSDTDNVYIDFEDARALDHSAIRAIDKLAERYRRAGKTLHLQHLSAECRLLLKTAKNLVEVNILEDPTYHVADDKLA